jgi:uncharacterized protein (TIGR03083 family)
VEIAEAFLRAADHFVELLDDPATAKRWEEASALEDLSVGGLVAHVVQGMVWLERLLDAPAPTGVAVIGLGEYITGFKVATGDDFQSEIHRYVRNMAEHGAARPSGDTRRRFGDVLTRLGAKLTGEAPDRLLDMRPTFPTAMRLDDRVRLEIVEFVVHGDDLAVSIGREDVDPPPEAVTIALATLLEAPRRRHGDRAVVRALARRERAAADVFPVL